MNVRLAISLVFGICLAAQAGGPAARVDTQDPIVIRHMNNSNAGWVPPIFLKVRCDVTPPGSVNDE